MTAVGRVTLPRLFVRFLRFGCLAFGGPAVQIEMLREELVVQERWVSAEHFGRALAVYQALPGPEATEMCCWFGMIARGRVGAIVAGLGFVLPGLALMLAASWLYARHGPHPLVAAASAGAAPAVVALLIRATARIGSHALGASTGRHGVTAAVLAGVGHVLGLPFWMTLPLCGAGVFLSCRGRRGSMCAGIVFAAALALALLAARGEWVTPRYAPLDQAQARLVEHRTTGSLTRADSVDSARVFIVGLRAGSLTFGGAYSALPFLHDDAVGDSRQGWVTERQFTDGVAIGGLLPAPLVIVGTFLGYLGGGGVGALLLTLGIFLPAFGFTVIGHRLFEGIVASPTAHGLLDGITAGVVGIMAATAVLMGVVGIRTLADAAICAAALGALFTWRTRWTVPLVLAASVLTGIVAGQVG